MGRHRRGDDAELRTRARRRPKVERLTAVAVIAWAVLTAGTGIAYLLPLSQDATDWVSNVSFGVACVMILATVVRAMVKVRGIDRLGWAMLFSSFLALIVLFAMDPASSNGPPTAALSVAPAVAGSLVVIVFLFGRRGVDRLALARLFVDGLWLTVGLVAASWWWVFEPMVQLRGPMLLAASFPVAIALTSASTVLLWPRLAGSARFAFGAIGLGGFVTTVAGVIHLKHAVAGTLVFGTWYDFLWMIGLTLLGLAALQPSMGSTLRARPPSARSEQLITCLPVVGLVVPLLHGEAWRRTPSAISIVMIVVLAVRVVILISQNQDLSNRLSDLAHRDDLTGLLNRRALLDHLDQIESTDGDATGNRGYALLYLDLDGFKEINDAWGHAAGDHVLATTAARLRSTLRADDAAARLGGDEFVVVTREHEARDLAERLLPILGQPIPWAGADLVVGCSIGVAATVGLTSAELLAEADGALYRSKVEGRNRVSVAGVPLDAA